MSEKIDIFGLDRAVLVHKLYEASKSQGMGSLIDSMHGGLSVQDVSKILSKGVTRFDYLQGRVMKVDIGPDELDPRLYDRDNGQGAAAAVVESMR